MSIYQQYLKEVELLKLKHQQELNELQEKFREQQFNCRHSSWTYNDRMFWFPDMYYPGKRCDECGIERRVTDEEYELCS